MTDYLLDTNHASHLLEGESRLLARLQAAAAGGDRFGITPTILGELYFAVFASRRQADNLSRLGSLVGALYLYPYDAAAAEAFGRIQAEQRAKGRPHRSRRAPSGPHDSDGRPPFRLHRQPDRRQLANVIFPIGLAPQMPAVAHVGPR